MMDKRIIDVATEDRFAVIEKKMRDVEAHVKGLTQELVDLKSFAMKISDQIEARDRQELKRGPFVQGSQPRTSAPGGNVFPPSSGTVVIPKGTRQPDTPVKPVMDNILQSDGTIGKEPRRGDKKPIVASPGRDRKQEGEFSQGKAE